MKKHPFSLLVALFACQLDVIIGMGWESISQDDFKKGWGNFKDGGSNAMLVKKYRSVRLRDGTSSSTVFHKKYYNVEKYERLRVTFEFCAVGVEKREGFFLELDDGSSWKRLKEYRQGRDFDSAKKVSEGCFEFATHEWDIKKKKMDSAKIRFRGTGNNKNDNVYIRDVLFEGFSKGGPPTTTTTPRGPTTTRKPGDGECHYIRLHWQEGYNWQQQGTDVPQDWCLTWSEDSDKSSALLKQCNYGSKKGLSRRQKWKIEDEKIKMCHYDKCLTRTDLMRGKWVIVDDCSQASDRQQFRVNDYLIKGETWMLTTRAGNGIKCNGPQCYYEGTFEGIHRKFPVYTFMSKGWKDGAKGRGVIRCLSNYLHHPKPNEALHLAPCSKVKYYRTLFWNFEEKGFGHKVGENY